MSGIMTPNKITISTLKLSIVMLGIITNSIMTLSITALSTMALSIIAPSIMEPSIMAPQKSPDPINESYLVLCVFVYGYYPIEQRILYTIAEKQLSYAATDV
jgi:hypothetical protein